MQTKYLVSTVLLFSLSLSAWTQSFDYAKAWQQVQTYEKQGLPAKALEATDLILQQATRHGDEVQQLKSLLSKANYRQRYQEDYLLSTIAEMESYLPKIKVAERAILQVALAEAYMAYFTQHQWLVRDIQHVDGLRPAAIKAWSTQNFLAKTDSLFHEALGAHAVLKNIAASTWKPLFHASTDEASIYQVQSTLYDFVLWKAIDYYQQHELENAAAEEAYLLNAPSLLQTYHSFETYTIPEEYGNTHKASLIRAYQQLIHMHKNNSQALLYEEGHRISHLSNMVYVDAKNTLQLQSYKKLYQQYKKDKAVAWVAMQYVELLAQSDKEKDLKEAALLCKTMQETAPDTPYFKTKWQQLHQPHIQLSFDRQDDQDVLLPHQSALLYVDSKNVSQLWFRLIALQPNEAQRTPHRDEVMIQKYAKRPAYKSFTQKLFDKPSLSSKKVLMRMPALEHGAYMLLASDRADFDATKANMQMQVCWVSSLRLVGQQSTGDYMVVDRQTGTPVENAEVKVYRKDWQQPDGVLYKTLSTNAKGAFHLPSVEGSVVFHIRHGKDYWQSGRAQAYVNTHKPQAVERHYFFTDRAIYRQGQMVHFKGILTSQIGDSVQLLTHKEVKVSFYNTQGKEIEQLQLRSNAYGSVSGQFSCPLQGLNGQLHISDGRGSVQVRMEAYKRPKFEVSLQAAKQAFYLGNKVEAEGQASYYMGSAVAQAKVVYRVRRAAFWPWLRHANYYPPVSGVAMPVAAGETTTDAQGKFQIAFTAKANDKTRYYSYYVQAEVIDATGEVHSQEISINVGPQALMLQADIPSIIDKDAAKPIAVHINNMQGQEVQANWQIKIERMAAPQQKQPYRILSQNLDKILIDKAIQEKDFPLIDFDTAHYAAKVEEVVYKQSVEAQQAAEIAAKLWKKLSVGHYRCTLSTTDSKGHKVEKTYPVLLISTAKKAHPASNNMYVYSPNKLLPVGDTYTFVAMLPARCSAVFYRISHANKLLAAGWKTPKTTYLQWQDKVLPAYRGGLSLQLFYAIDGRWYSQQQNFVVPYDNKQLDIQLQTFRSTMEPGHKENWRIKISDHHKQPVEAELMAGMYDMSLDALQAHQWHWQLYPQQGSMLPWASSATYCPAYSNIKGVYPSMLSLDRPLRFLWQLQGQWEYKMRSGGRQMDKLGAPMASYAIVDDDIPITEQNTNPPVPPSPPSSAADKKESAKPSLRKNLNETAFFYPQLHSDAQGEAQLSFVAPEALSKWKLMLLAYTKAVQTDYKTESCQTQKELMILPHLPRFFRGGDSIVISARVMSLMNKAQIVDAKLSLLDANTGKAIAGGDILPRQFELLPQGQKEVEWMWHVPDNIGAVIVRMYAKGAKHQDAEEHLLPVLSPMVYLTDSYPFSLGAQQQLKAQDIGLDKTQQMQDERLSFELVSNPLWYVVQALPNYPQPQQPAPLSWAYYYFIQSMGKHVVEANPEIEHVFKQWQQQSPDALESKLSHNEQLKTVLLQQTPWVMQAEKQSQRQHAIANYFSHNKHAYAMQQAIDKLQEAQLSNGAWAWFQGMAPSPYITARILALLGHLQTEGIVDIKATPQLNAICRKATDYLDAELETRWQHVQAEEIKGDYAADYMSARALFLQLYPLRGKTQAAYDGFLAAWQQPTSPLAITQKRALAKVLMLSGKPAQAKALARSIADHALRDTDGATYWRDFAYHRSAEQQARTLLLFQRLDMPAELIKGMKLWLLKQKRTQDWGNNEGTAWACLSMLRNAPQLMDSPKVTLWIDGQEHAITGQAGTGYFVQSWQGKQADMDKIRNSIRVQVGSQANALVFGAFYRQGFVPASAVKAHEGGMALRKEYLLEKHNKQGVEYEAVQSYNNLPLGSTLLVRMHIANEQAMDFVHLRDALPAGFEPQNLLSACQWKAGLFFYRTPSDQAVDYFISHLPKGSYIIDYKLFVSAQGVLSVGPVSIQSAYEPAFGAHSKGATIRVQKNP